MSISVLIRVRREAQASSSSLPTATTAPPPPPPPPPPANHNAPQKVNLSPYLLVGVLLALLILGWKILSSRRRRLRMLQRREELMLEMSLQPDPDALVKPLLWDVLIDLEEQKWVKDGGLKGVSRRDWDTIIPLSATELDSCVSAPNPNASKKDSKPSRSPIHRPKWLLSPSKSRPKNAPSPEPETTTTTLQVEILIAMPSPEYPQYFKDKRRRTRAKDQGNRMEDMDYCIGSRDCIIDDQ